MSKQIPFKISARAARLIGRQNFSNADGAIIELVKNTYDADAKTCIVLFENKFAEIPQVLDRSEYLEFRRQCSLIEKFYDLHESEESSKYHFSGSTSPNKKNQSDDLKRLSQFFHSKCKIFIIDDGEGMTSEIIESHWMTIGTNNKESEFLTREGRIKTGAKGIGRFALDRLGDYAELFTKPDTNKHTNVQQDGAFLWEVNWSDFEASEKTLNEITAELIEEKVESYSTYIEDQVPNEIELKQLLRAHFKTGTIITISNLRDTWDDYSIRKLFSNLQALIPPMEQSRFDLYVYSTSKPSDYGQVPSILFDEYDYKISAIVRDGKAKIKLERNELDISELPQELFEYESMSSYPFDLESLSSGEVIYTKSLNELVPGLKLISDENIFDDIGEFSCTFYYLKRTLNRNDQQKFKQKSINPSVRTTWLKDFGGIKLYRDNFRVRPYGEVDQTAFDWLDLAGRVEKSTAGIGHPTGLWRVRPNQIAGFINISRLKNIELVDKSNREGIQETPSFSYFKHLISGILDVFERDRQHIARPLKQIHDKQNRKESTKTKAEEIEKKVNQRRKERNQSESEKETGTVLDYAADLKEEIELLKDELQLLRILASSGLIVANFKHELHGIRSKLKNRIEDVKTVLNKEDLIDQEKLNNIPAFLNPFRMLDAIQRQDTKLQFWLNFSLDSIRPDKRRRKKIDLLNYFREYQQAWEIACIERKVDFQINLNQLDELSIRVFEADLDTIFNNLLINSFEAFLRKDATNERIILIELNVRNSDVIFTYSDSGPGLSKDISEPRRIFEPHFTTKRNQHTGEEIGTGLGMSLVKSFIEENNGEIESIGEAPGFKLVFSFKEKVK